MTKSKEKNQSIGMELKMIEMTEVLNKIVKIAIINILQMSRK